MALIVDIFKKRDILNPWELISQKKDITAYLNLRPAIREPYKQILLQLPEYPTIQSRIGIEIECEFIDPGSWDLVTWQQKSDGSLRNSGVEYISPAMQPSDIRDNLAILLAFIAVKHPKADFSWRTSVHVHLECKHMEIDAFKMFLLLYLLFEDALFQYANPGRRETNVFCTPLTRTNFYALSDFINTDNMEFLGLAFSMMCGELKKYSALNLNHMYDFGTIEFRHLRGTGDPKKLGIWIALLLRLFQTATQMRKEDFIQDIASLNTTSSYREFTQKIFGGELASIIESSFHSFFLSKGISLVKEVVYGKTLFDTITYSTTGGLARFIGLKEKQQKSDLLALKSKRKNRNPF